MTPLTPAVTSAREALGRVLREARAQAGLTRRDLATRMGYRNISKGCSRLAAWERGDDVPRGDRPLRLVEALPGDGAALQAAIEAEVEACSIARSEEAAITTANLEASDLEATLVHANLSTLEDALEGPDGTWLREARTGFARMQLAYLGGRVLRLGELVDLWASEHLRALCSCHARSMRVFRLAGNPLSGRHHLRGICPVTGEASAGQRDRQGSQTLLAFVRPALPARSPAASAGPGLEDALLAAGCTMPAIDITRVGGGLFGTWTPKEATLRDPAGRLLAALPPAPSSHRWEAERGPKREGGRPVIGSISPMSFGAWRGECLVVTPEIHRPWRAGAGHLADHHGRPRLTWTRQPPPRLVAWLAGQLART